MPTVATVEDSGTFSLDESVGDNGMGWGGDIHQLEDLIITRFLSQYSRTRIFGGGSGPDIGAVLISVSFQGKI